MIRVDDRTVLVAGQLRRVPRPPRVRSRLELCLLLVLVAVLCAAGPVWMAWGWLS